MSWQIHWQVPFASFDGGQYRANILEEDYSGSVVTLTGAAQPFTTAENAAEDVFTPIRKQTGYLRIVTDDTTLLESIMPANNVEKLVELRYGTGDMLMWRGFLQAQVFTQPWDNNLRQLEFPVKSVLAALEDVRMESSLSAERGKLWPILVYAMNELNVTPSKVMLGTSETTIGSIFQHTVKYGVFFSDEQIDNEGVSVTSRVNDSYYNVLESIASLHGLTFREYGDVIFIMDYISSPLANIGNICAAEFSWTNLVDGVYVPISVFHFPSHNLLPIINSAKRGSDNVFSFIRGRKSVKVVVNLEDGESTLAALPSTTEDASQVILIESEDGRLYGQPHSPRQNSIETYVFSDYQNINPQQKTDSTSANCIEKSPFYRTSQAGVILYPIITGAFPVRWAFREAGDVSQAILENGLFMSLVQDSGVYVSPDSRQCYSLKTQYAEHLTDGYLNINMNFVKFTSTDFASSPSFNLNCFLKYGDKIWNGTSWETYSDSLVSFQIQIVEGSIAPNIPEGLLVENEEGHFIPVNGEMTGQIEFGILDYHSGITSSAALYLIMSTLNVGYYYPSDITVSTRTSNSYYRSLLSKGFSEERAITTNIGTWNNNLPGLSFLYDDDSEYIQTVEYKNQGVSSAMRPELHLLGLMANYFASVRRTMTQVMKLENFCERLYAYDGRYYVAIDERHDWRDNKQRVKFLEIK